MRRLKNMKTDNHTHQPQWGNKVAHRIKEVAKEFKQINGNAEFTNKDMITYLISRVERIDVHITDIHNMYSNQFKDCSGRFLLRSTYWKITTIFVALVCGTLGYVFSLIHG